MAMSFEFTNYKSKMTIKLPALTDLFLLSRYVKG